MAGPRGKRLTGGMTREVPYNPLQIRPPADYKVHVILVRCALMTGEWVTLASNPCWSLKGFLCCAPVFKVLVFHSHG